MRALAFTAVLLVAGCGKDEPKTVNIDLRVNGKPIDFEAIEKRQSDEGAAKESLSKWKTKWFTETGEFKNKVWPNLTMAASEAGQIHSNHPKTESGKQAQAFERQLLDAKADAKDKGVFPTIPVTQ